MGWTTENKGADRRVVVTKSLPGRRWRQVLALASCEVVISDSQSVLTVDEIAAAIGARCDGAIGQLTEQWAADLFTALARAGGKAYSNYAVGYDNVRVEEATRRGIAVGNTPGVLTETTAEMAVALTFAAARRVPEAERYLRAGKFHGWLPDLFLGKRLWGGTLGIVGAGRIGAAYAQMMAAGFAMSVVYWDAVENTALSDSITRLADALGAPGGPRPRCERLIALDELLARSDVVSLHVSLNDATRHLIDARRLLHMKPDAILVNTSRGPVVDEAALAAHLRSHPRFRAGLDVFEREPALAPGLAELDNAILVPHIASATDWTREGMAVLAALNVCGVLQGFPVAEKCVVEDFLGPAPPRLVPSIVNARELGLGRA